MIDIRDMRGRTVFLHQLKDVPAGFALPVDISVYANGVYALRVSTEEAMRVLKLILQK
jgi:hypothetical protein